MNRKPKVAAMLALIEQRLKAYPIEETLERFHSYGGEGPTVEEFLENLEICEYRSDFFAVADFERMSSSGVSISRSILLSHNVQIVDSFADASNDAEEESDMFEYLLAA
ncbi:hypothetical protein [Pseudomonas viridiflava]|uniref:hypothetical protein n=1 Tax=Pseudomonas viridiflava TaxID=33069 RepID=UPI000F040F23|nr:hypothetical protein [Pseudomonas viridiflava]